MLVGLLVIASISNEAAAVDRLFPPDLPARQWVQFPAAGFDQPVSAVIYRGDNPTCCGCPVGGLGTGCIDIGVDGTFGLISTFQNHIYRESILRRPFLGISDGDRTWLLTTQEVIDGSKDAVKFQNLHGCGHGYYGKTIDHPVFEGVSPARQIDYFGHYPVVDIEFQIDLPVSVGLRAWSPFIPGDLSSSNTPAAIFEVHLRNEGETEQAGTLAFCLPGYDQPIDPHIGEGEFELPPTQRHMLRSELNRDELHGVYVHNTEGTGYVLATVGDEQPRIGGDLHATGRAWAQITHRLPEVIPAGQTDDGQQLFEDSGTSIAVEYTLAPGESRIIRFVASWYMPTPVNHYGSRYTNYYTTRYADAVEPAAWLAQKHESLLQRVINWQQVIYAKNDYPVWMRDALINYLYLIAESSPYFVVPDMFAKMNLPNGVLGMTESPRTCSDMGTIPCDFLGLQPFIYFFPELAINELRMHVRHMRADGAVELAWTNMQDVACSDRAFPMVSPGQTWHTWQQLFNAHAFCDLVSRLWEQTDDPALLSEFYPAVKASTQYVMGLNTELDGLISMPTMTAPGDYSSHWYEQLPWFGRVTHSGGTRLAMLKTVERMADAQGDEAFAQRCRDWYAEASASLESKMWNAAEATADEVLVYPATWYPQKTISIVGNSDCDFTKAVGILFGATPAHDWTVRPDNASVIECVTPSLADGAYTVTIIGGAVDGSDVVPPQQFTAVNSKIVLGVAAYANNGQPGGRLSNLLAFDPLQPDHDVPVEPAKMWRSYDKWSDKTIITFDLGVAHGLSQIQVWNYNAPGQLDQGVKRMSIAHALADEPRVVYPISEAADPDYAHRLHTYTQLDGPDDGYFQLIAGDGSPSSDPTVIDLTGVTARFIRFVDCQPFDGNSASVGLSRVVFVGTPVPDRVDDPRAKYVGRPLPSYLNYHQPETGQSNAFIMANQLDGQFIAKLHGLGGVFQRERVTKVLDTVYRANYAPFGTVAFATADGRPTINYGDFCPQNIMLGMTYLYEGREEQGLEIIQRGIEHLYLKQGYTWDLPNVLSYWRWVHRNDHEDARIGYGSGQRAFGTDYYQNNILWLLPAAMAGQPVDGPFDDGLVRDLLDAANAN
jgi:uncharacterized protein (DUF608 family)